MLSASYDVDIAIEYGIPAAALLNKLVYLSRKTPREDGWCWRTASELKDELGLGERSLRNAIKKLEEGGLVETKNTFIIHTTTKCRHFFITNKGWRKLGVSDKSDLYERYKSEMDERYKSLYIGNSNTGIIKNSNDDSYKTDFSVFDAIWGLYPNKQGKRAAFKAYKSALKDGVSTADILAGVERYAEYVNASGTPKKYIKHGDTWFRNRCWEDDLPEVTDDAAVFAADMKSGGGDGWLNKVSLPQ